MTSSPDTEAGHAGAHQHAGHHDHAAQFRDRFALTLVLAVPVVASSPMVGMFLGYTPPGWSAWIAPALGSVIFFWGGWPFLTGAVSEIRTRRPGMMLLIGTAITVAFGASLLGSLGIGGLDFWWELALLVVIMLLGHWLEMRALGQASGALDALAALLPDTAERVGQDGTVETVAPAALAAGDTVLVRSGGRVPADGTVVDGTADVDESMITGESRPVTRSPGDRVVAGTIATDSALRVRVDAVGEDTALSGIRRLVERATASRSRAQALADRAAALLFWFAAGAAVLTFAAWTLLGELPQAVVRTVTVLVIACPHALGLAIPLVIAISTARAARAGILVTDRLALERTRSVDTVLFDKTGTLTTGTPEVVGVAGAEDTLSVAARVEVDSEHPLARAVVAAAGPVPGPPARDFRSLTGRGVRAVVDGEEVAVGGPGLITDLGLDVPADLRERADAWHADGATVLYLVRTGEQSKAPGQRVTGAIALADTVRPESRAAVEGLHARGVRVVMITGDARPVADAVARDLGVDEVFAEVLPADKDDVVARLQARGGVVAMVGDGVNDAPALARADVGIAIGAGTDVAIGAAGVVLAGSDPRGVLSVIALSRAGYRKMVQNLWWAAGYNLVSVPLAAGVLAPAGFVLPPAVGAVLMSLSTIVVALNAQLLRRVELRPDRLA
ncbi:copper-translocating P-type ATPase [Pseudonocardia nematodicida]|uniref:Copper-translocating P-type ATPase n=1 Tax=Pseudonocardia nematodicida TaxID=1206997 RepID=A0ABV1KII6_9PSEU